MSAAARCPLRSTTPRRSPRARAGRGSVGGFERGEEIVVPESGKPWAGEYLSGSIGIDKVLDLEPRAVEVVCWNLREWLPEWDWMAESRTHSALG
jgi:hypothetical protein